MTRFRARRSLAVAVLMGAVAGLAAGCTGGPAARPSPGPSGVLSPASAGTVGADGVAALVREFGTPAFGDVQGHISIVLAENEVARRCMKRKGFSYSYDPEEITRRLRKILGSATTVTGPVPSFAPSNGYGLYAQFVADPSMAAPPPPNSGHGADETAPVDPHTVGMSTEQQKRYDLALNGFFADYKAKKDFDQRTKFTVPVPAALLRPGQKLPQDEFGGCFGEGLIMVSGGHPEQLDAAKFMQGAVGTVIRQALAADGTYQKTVAGWRSCMTAQGFDFASPAAAHDAVFERYVKDGGATADAHDYEMAVAAQDAACRKASGIVHAGDRAAQQAARAFVVKWEPELLQARSDRQEAVARAKTILAGGTPSPLATALASPAPAS